MSAALNSCAIDRRGLTRCCAARLARSPTPRTFGNHALRDAASQPASNAAAPALSMRWRKRRRDGSLSTIGMLLLNDIASRDHRAQIIDDTADCDLKYVHEHKGNQGPRGKEMQSSRGLASADDVDPARDYGIEARRQRPAHQHHEWQQPKNHQKIGQLL